MKSRIGWTLAMVAVMSFSFGQAGAAASQMRTLDTASGTKQTAPPASVAAASLPDAAAPAAMNGPTSPTDETKVPHYFGPYPNWANSPQVLSNAIVTITPSDGAGTGAEATAAVVPKTGAIGAITVTSPGTGYTAPPTVEITAPGMTPTTTATASSVISSGVVTSIAVDEAGFGFTVPSVTIEGGGTPSAVATAQASGGVDDLTVSSGGSGYVDQPIVKLGLPDAAYCAVFTAPATSPCVQATGSATMTAGVVKTVTVENPGSGYTSAPTVDILDGLLPNGSGPATVKATMGIGQIDMVDGGAGYDSVPTVTITDSVAPFDKNASATAKVAVKGAVTDITVTAAGAGYLTPGLRKFVDTLSGLGASTKNNLGQYIPQAVPDTTTYPGSDYYEIAVVQYRMKFHTDLPDTLLRGYVQLSTSVVPGAEVPLTNANLDPTQKAVPAMLPAVGTSVPLQGTGVDEPHYLGPTIVATKDRPVRVLFRNLLPTGVGGDLFLPVDTSMMGSGMGPDGMMLDPVTKVPHDMTMDKGTVMDEVRNPMCAATPKPADCFAENRATLHLHGGITPWISDGTPHQWVTPDGQDTAYPKGVSVSNVPDMPDPGPGAQTFFYTNQQSARLMWTHDHSWGITRLNVYAGEAAGYLLTDKTEQKLINGGALDGLGLGTPLIVQDKTFVSTSVGSTDPAVKLASTDPTWNADKWGGEGSLWTPHVYMPAQNPGDPSGMSSFGRWMYGPWFWPPAKDVKYPPIANPYFDATCDPDVQAFCEPALIPSTPNVSVGMEAFNDTPIVNGTAYPTTTVDPKAYRYKILNAANDRFWNLSWYVADPTTGTLSEVALNSAEVVAAQTDPVVMPTPDTAKSPKGPDWVQIGTEGGFLPAPVVVPAQPTTWITDPTRFDVGNVDKHSLLLAPAERADVVVDFSQFRGKTLILYNDAPAAFPARVPGYDYYTGGPDLTPAGAQTTLPGYGPNTRTIMQVKVSTVAPAVAFDRPNTTADRMGALNAAFAHQIDTTTGEAAGVFESGQDPIIVGQDAYDSAYGTNFAAAGYCNSVTTTTSRCDGFARIDQQGGDTFKFDTLGPNKDGTGPQLGVKIEPKGIHDEMNSASFDEWGRMTANMGLEAPGATPLLQNIILYPFTNPATELLEATSSLSSLDVTPVAPATGQSAPADGTQIWKITHNGVDTHPLHFHLNSVQLINRVTWDNIIIPPEPSELGWKETIRVSPLEDTIIAVRPIVPTLPFGIPDSVRPLNPMMPLGAKGSTVGLGYEAGFNSTDANGNPMAPIENAMTNFDWEYVWHCHILSHEEMDMMRPIKVHVARALPEAPVLSFTRGSVILSWTDGTPVTAANYADPASWTLKGTAVGTAEAGYRIDRAEVIGGTVGAFAEIASGLANTTTYTDKPDPSATYDYRVTAWNAAGDSPSNVVRVDGLPKAPTGLTAVATAAPTLPSGWQVDVGWTNNATNASGVKVERALGAAAFSVVATLAPDATTWLDTTVVPGTYRYQVSAIGAAGPSAPAGPVTVTVGKSASTTVVLSAPNPSSVGESVTFTATVSSALATVPTGTVVFTADNVSTSMTVDALGVATVTTSALPAGTHAMTAAYGGDSLFLPSTGSVTQTVNKAATSTVVVSSLNPSAVGGAVTFTASVSTVSASTPTGSVVFTIDGVAVPGVSLVAGQATYSTSALAIGAHPVIATYSGDLALAGSTSPTLTQTVGSALRATTTTVTSDRTPSANLGQRVTFTVTVRPVTGTGTPTGTVQLNIDGVNVGGPRALSRQGLATYSTTTLSAGPHNVVATYGGSAIFAGGGSPTFIQIVDQAASTTVLTSNRNPSVSGQGVTFTARVSPSAATGTVDFWLDGKPVGGPVTLVTGRATLVTNLLAAGNHTLAAVYNGNVGYLPSASATLTQRVSKATSRTVVASSSPTANRGISVVFTATVTARGPATGIPTGSVQFRVDGVNSGSPVSLNPSGQAAYATSTLSAGRHTVSAVYTGDPSFNASTSGTITQRIR